MKCERWEALRELERSGIRMGAVRKNGKYWRDGKATKLKNMAHMQRMKNERGLE